MYKRRHVQKAPVNNISPSHCARQDPARQQTVTSHFKTAKAHPGIRADPRHLQDYDNVGCVTYNKGSHGFMVPHSTQGKVSSTFKSHSRASAMLKGSPFKLDEGHRVVPTNSRSGTQSTPSQREKENTVNGAKQLKARKNHQQHPLPDTINPKILSYSKQEGICSQQNGAMSSATTACTI